MVRLSEAARDERAEERRGQILRAALEVFGQKGFHGATVREIASAAGLAEGTIYLYFASKHEVLRGVFALIADEVANAPDGHAADQGDDRAFLTALIESRVRSLARHASFIRLSIHEADLYEGLRREFFERLCGPFVARFERHLEARIAQGAFRPVNTHLAASIVFRMIVSYVMVQHVLDVDRSSAAHSEDDYIGTMVSLILHGLARPADEGRPGQG